MWCLAAELASPALLCGLLLARAAPAACFVVLGACMFAVHVLRFVTLVGVVLAFLSWNPSTCALGGRT